MLYWVSSSAQAGSYKIADRGTAVADTLRSWKIMEAAAMKEESANNLKPATLSFECDCCGQFFESWERLRHHQVDCQSDEFESAI